MTINKDKKRIQITIPKQKYFELKHMAIDQGTTVSELLISGFKGKEDTLLIVSEVDALVHESVSEIFHHSGNEYWIFDKQKRIKDKGEKIKKMLCG